MSWLDTIKGLVVEEDPKPTAPSPQAQANVRIRILHQGLKAGRRDGRDIDGRIKAGEQAVVPGRVLGQPIIGDHERLGLSLAKMVEANGWYFGPAEQLAG